MSEAQFSSSKSVKTREGLFWAFSFYGKGIHEARSVFKFKKLKKKRENDLSFEIEFEEMCEAQFSSSMTVKTREGLFLAFRFNGNGLRLGQLLRSKS